MKKVMEVRRTWIMTVQRMIVGLTTTMTMILQRMTRKTTTSEGTKQNTKKAAGMMAKGRE
jgi:hypothetical protein